MSRSFLRQAISVASPPLLAAVLIYVVLTRGLPRLADHEPVFRSLADRLVVLAPLLGAAFVLVALVAVLRLAWQSVRDGDPELADLRALSWSRFSSTVTECLRRQGYSVSMRDSVGPGDIEMVASKRGEKVLVQCRQWRKRSIDVDSVRELCGWITAEKANRGLFITCGEFSLEAMRFAKDLPISLMDGAALLQWMHGDASAARPNPKPEAEPVVPAAPSSIERGIARLRSNPDSGTGL